MPSLLAHSLHTACTYIEAACRRRDRAKCGVLAALLAPRCSSGFHPFLWAFKPGPALLAPPRRPGRQSQQPCVKHNPAPSHTRWWHPSPWLACLHPTHTLPNAAKMREVISIHIGQVRARSNERASAPARARAGRLAN